MGILQDLCCPNCGGNQFDELTQSKVICEYCGSVSVYTQADNTLTVNGWRCPSCIIINPVKSKFCGKCGIRITKHCPKCGEDVQHFSNYCTGCSYQYYPGEFTIEECDTFGTISDQHLTLTNRRLCSSSSIGYYEVLLTDIEKEKLKSNNSLIHVIEFRNRKGNNKIRLSLHAESKFLDVFFQTLVKYR